MEPFPGSPALKEALGEWHANRQNADKVEEVLKTLGPLLEDEREAHPLLKDVWETRDLLPKLSQWIIGGDGWAYDIGYGGLDHVLAQVSGDVTRTAGGPRNVTRTAGGRRGRGALVEHSLLQHALHERHESDIG